MKFHSINSCVCPDCLQAKTELYKTMQAAAKPKPVNLLNTGMILKLVEGPAITKKTVSFDDFWSSVSKMQPVISPVLAPDDHRATIRFIWSSMRHLKKHYNYDLNKSKCDALGCGKCTVEKCIMAELLTACDCPHCPFKAYKNEIS